MLENLTSNAVLSKVQSEIYKGSLFRCSVENITYGTDFLHLALLLRNIILMSVKGLVPILKNMARGKSIMLSLDWLILPAIFNSL